MYCPCCGARLPDAASFCGTCGAHVEGSALGPSQPENARSRKVNKKVIIAVSVAVVLIAAVVTLSLLLGGSNSKTYEELIVGSWYSDEHDNYVTFYYDGFVEGDGSRRPGGIRAEKGEVCYKIKEDTLLLCHSNIEEKATIEKLNEKELEISWRGETVYYERQVYDELIVGSWCEYNASGDVRCYYSYYNDGTCVGGFPTDDGSIRVMWEGHWRIEGDTYIIGDDTGDTKYTIETLNKEELVIWQADGFGFNFERVDFDPFDP